MSEDYEDYSTTSKDYDRGRRRVRQLDYATLLHNTDGFSSAARQIVGLEVILGALTVNTKRQLRELHILDVGTTRTSYSNPWLGI